MTPTALDLLVTNGWVLTMDDARRTLPCGAVGIAGDRIAAVEEPRALGLGAHTGSLEPGKRADLIVVNTQRPHLVPMHHPASQLVYAARGGDVETVVINGRRVMQDGRIPTFEVDAAMVAVNRIARRVRSRH